MNELQKEYMIDALSELDDRYIAEAAAYKPPKGRWKFVRELGAVAACVATLLITAAVWQYLPIGDFSAKDAMKPESMEWSSNSNMKQEAAMEEGVAAPESTKDSVIDKNGIKYEGLEEESQNITWKLLYEHTKAPENYYKYVIHDIHINHLESAIGGSISNEHTGFLEGLPKELLASGQDVFRGTVTQKQVYQVTEGLSAYFTVLTVEVTEVIGGELSVGDSCRIYLPVARAEDGTQIQDTYAAGDLLMLSLEVGSDAVFIPHMVTAESGRGNEQSWLSYGDFAKYYFEDGIYTLFLGRNEGEIVYAEDVNRLKREAGQSLEDVTAYLQELLEE